MKAQNLILNNESYPLLQAETNTTGNSGLKLSTGDGYIMFGPLNTSHAHLETDRSNFYFNKEIRVDSGVVSSYNEDLYLRRASNSSHQIQIGTTGITNSLKTTFSAGLNGQAILLNGAQNFDNLKDIGFYSLYNVNASGSVNAPFQYGTMISTNSNASGGMGMQLAHERTGGGFYVRGMNDSGDTWYDWDEIWTSGTDGSGSGLDADTLDGQQGSFYQNAGNLNAGTIPEARLPTQSKYLRSDADDTMSRKLTFSQHNSGSYMQNPGGVTFSSVSAGDNSLILRNLGQFRFEDENNWDWNKWGGIKYDSSANTMYIGGPAASQFTSNASPPSIDVNFVGLNSSGLKKDGNVVWHAGNDGPGSGLNADTLDGEHGSYYAPKASPSFSGTVYTSASQNAWAFRATTGSTSNSSGLWFTGTTARILLRDSSGTLKTMLAANGTNAENVINGNTIWHAGNDGSGSGLNADLLDGTQKESFFYDRGTSQIGTGTSWDITAPGMYGVASSSAFTGTNNPGFSSLYTYGVLSVFEANGQGIAQLYTPHTGNKIALRTGWNNGGWYGWQQVWTSTSDGSGSGLDADLLDGQQGSYYRNAGNLNAGTIPEARLPTQSKYLRSDTNDTTSGYLEAEGFVGNGSVLRISHPRDATYHISSSSVTGAIKVTLPVTWTNTMMRMTIKVYDYSGSEAFEVMCGGYNYSPSTSWINTFAYILCDPSVDRNFNVRFGHDGSKCAIYIGETTSSWSYLKVAVTEFEAGHSSYSAETWNDGWDISLVTSLGTITKTESNPQIGKYVAGHTVWHAGNDGPSSGLDADTLDGQQGSYYYAASNPNGYTTNAGTVIEGGTTFNGTYPMVVRVSANNIYSHPNVTFAGSTNTLSVSGTVNSVSGFTVSNTTVINSNRNIQNATLSTGTAGTRFATGGWFVDSANQQRLQFVASSSNYYKTDGSAGKHFFFDGNSTTEAAADAFIDASGNGHFAGNVTAYSSSVSSDIRLKENIRPIESATETIKQLNGVIFDWKKTERGTDQLGFIAQEVEEVLPSLVTKVQTLKDENTETHKTVNYAALVPMLVESIKELKTEIDNLKIQLKEK